MLKRKIEREKNWTILELGCVCHMFVETPAFLNIHCRTKQLITVLTCSFQGLDKDLGNNIMNNHTGTLTDTLSAIVTVSDNTNSY